MDALVQNTPPVNGKLEAAADVLSGPYVAPLAGPTVAKANREEFLQQHVRNNPNLSDDSKAFLLKLVPLSEGPWSVESAASRLLVREDTNDGKPRIVVTEKDSKSEAYFYPASPMQEQILRYEEPPARQSSAPSVVSLPRGASIFKSLSLPQFTDFKNFAEFAGVVREHFERFDADGNGFISSKEISKAIESGEHKGYARVALEALKRTVETLQQFSNDEIGTENDGVTKADIRAAEALIERKRKDENLPSETQKQLEELETGVKFAAMHTSDAEGITKITNFLVQHALTKFSQWDTDKNGFLSAEELEALRKQPDISHMDAVTLRFLSRACHGLQTFSRDEYSFLENDGITRNDLTAAEETMKNFPRIPVKGRAWNESFIAEVGAQMGETVAHEDLRAAEEK
jgi:hypothetical protein